MRDPLDPYRRAAKALKKSLTAGEPQAVARWQAVHSDAPPSHAGALHVIAVEGGHASWPRMKFTLETQALDREARQRRLASALYHGQHWRVAQLLKQDADLAQGHLGLTLALCRRAEGEAMLDRDPARALRAVDGRLPLVWLAFSQHITAHPDLSADQLALAARLVALGADVNAGVAAEPESPHMLSPLYGAVGHAGNMALTRWLLEQGADPNDNESLYHATELGHHDGLRLLLAHGADPKGTNALLRAMDFNDHAAVELLLAAGADPAEHVAEHAGDAPVMVLPALHQAARRDGDARMVAILRAAGADADACYDGMTAFELASMMGNTAVAEALGGEVSPPLVPLVAAAWGKPVAGYVDPAKLPDEARLILHALLVRPGRLDHIRRLVAIGVEYDRADAMGMTPVQVAGWEGLAEEMGYLLSLGPDLSHVNGFGGTLLSTIIHGSENCPARANRDHLTCARIVLEYGVALPRAAVAGAGEPDMAALLADWADRYPGQVVALGPG